jgi:hypothetical protein
MSTYNTIEDEANVGGKPKGKKRLARIAAVLLLLFAADQGFRMWEYSQILAVAEDSEDVLNKFEDDIFNAQDGLLINPEGADESAAELAAVAEEEMLFEADVLAGISILPWHGDLQQLLVDYKAHNAAWVEAAQYAKIKGDGQVLNLDDIDMINFTWDVAVATFNRTLPTFDFFGFEERVLEIQNG